MMTVKRNAQVLVMLLAGLVLLSAANAQQVMEQIPDDALLVVKVRNMSGTSTKVGKFMTDLGLAAMMPGLDNPLGLLQQKLGLTQGVKQDGDMAIVWRDPEIVGVGRPDQSIALLIPVTDYAAFVSNFGGAKPEGDITTVKIPQSGDDGFIAKWGNFAALTPAKAVLEKKPSTIMKVSGAASNKELSGRDIVVYANMAALRPRMQKGLAEAREEGMDAISGLNDEKVAKFQPVIKAVLTQALNVADAFVRDANAVTFSFNFSDEGINIAAMGDFQPGTYAGNNFSALKNTDQPLLAGIPTAKYLFYGGQINNPEVSGKCLTDFATPILKELDAIGPEMKPAHDYFDALMAFMKANKSQAFGVIAPTGALGQESLVQVVSVAEGDAKAMKDAQQKMIKSQQELMKALDLPTETYDVTITPNSKTVDGVNFDSITTNFAGNANDPKSRQQQQVMSYVYGPNGMNMLEAEVAGRYMFAMCVPDEVLSSTIATAKSGAAPMSELATVKKVASNLPTKRLGEFYVPLDQILMTVASYAKQFGAPVNLNLPPDLPPVGGNLSADGPSMKLECYVPTQLVQQLVSAGMQTYMQLQGGGGKGNGKL